MIQNSKNEFYHGHSPNSRLAIPRIPFSLNRSPGPQKKNSKSSNHLRTRMLSVIERASTGKFFSHVITMRLYFPLMIFIYLLFVDILHFSCAQAHKLEQSWGCFLIMKFWRETPIISN